jgi:4-amino-4-deoxy-L-arabinose transferase-like glycosyltransferase
VTRLCIPADPAFTGESGRRRLRRLAFALVLLTAATRLPSVLQSRPIDDETVYSVVANEIVDGGRPYVDAVERKPPLLFWTYAAVFETAGKFNWVALHTAAVLWVLLTMAGLYLLARRGFNAETGLIAALLYGIYQPWGIWKNLAFNGEMLMNLPLVWAWAIGLGPSRSRSRIELLAAGALLGAGFLLKQPAAIAAVPLGVYLCDPRYRSGRGYTPADSMRHGALLSAGFAGTLGAVAAVLHRQGILREAVYWTVTNHALQYIFWGRGIENTLGFAVACLPLAAGAALSLRDHDLWNGKEAERFALGGWLVVSAIGVTAGGRFYPHYYIQLIPPLAVLAAPYYAELWYRRPTAHPWWWSARVTRAWLAVTVVVFLLIHCTGLWLVGGTSETGQYIREHSSPDDRIFVWGQSPSIYLDSRRRPASRYITTFPLTGYIFGPPMPDVDTRDRIVPGAWSNFEQDVHTHPPAFIVYTEVNAGARYPLAQFPALARLVAERYRVVTSTADGLIYRRTDLPKDDVAASSARRR